MGIRKVWRNEKGEVIGAFVFRMGFCFDHLWRYSISFGLHLPIHPPLREGEGVAIWFHRCWGKIRDDVET